MRTVHMISNALGLFWETRGSPRRSFFDSHRTEEFAVGWICPRTVSTNNVEEQPEKTVKADHHEVMLTDR